MIWVLDASVALRWFLKDESHPNADAVLDRLVEAPERFAVPELFAFEVLAVLHRLHPAANRVFRKGVIPILNGGLLRQPMTRKLADDANHFVVMGLTACDACYAALAHDLKATWLTFDRRAHQHIAAEAVSHLLSECLPQDWDEK